jgi:NADPH:quinone reductase-like Zn-dependent oxidoreductase
MVGGEFVRKNLDALKPDGRLCQIAFLSGWPWFASGRVGVPLDKVFPLADAAAAHAYLESGGHLGKGGSAGSGDSDVKLGVSEKITVTF